MDHYPVIARHFQHTVEAVMSAVDPLAEPLQLASERLAQALLGERKILACGVGADAALAQLFVCHMLGRFEHDRPALPALSLVADGASASGFGGDSEERFARQLTALGQPGDVLLGICSEASDTSLQRALQAAHAREMDAVLLLSAGDDQLTTRTASGDILLPVVAGGRAQVIEIQTMLLNCLAELIDQGLFGGYPQD